MSQEEEAVHFYGRALELGLSGPEAVNAYAQIGSMYRLRGRLADSVKELPPLDDFLEEIGWDISYRNY